MTAKSSFYLNSPQPPGPPPAQAPGATPSPSEARSSFFHETGDFQEIISADTAAAAASAAEAAASAASAAASVAAIPALANETEAEAGTNSAKLMTPERVSQAMETNALGFKNIAGRNGGFEVWQRGTSISVAASTAAYTVDGFYLATGANQACTVSQQTGLTSGSPFCARVQRNSGQTGTGTLRFAMPLTGAELKRAAGNAIQMVFTVSTGANWSPTSGTLSYTVYFGTGSVAKRNGSAYTGETTPISGTVNLAQGASATQVVSGISSAVGSSVSCAEIQFSWTPVGTASTNDWFSIDDLDLRVVPTGLSASKPTFERSPFEFDLLRCMRHLQWWQGGTQGALAFGGIFSTTDSFFVWILPVPMRAAPTGTVSAGTDFLVFDAATSALITSTAAAVAPGNVTPFSVNIVVSVASGLTLGNTAGLEQRNTNSFISWSAEI